MQQKSRNKRFRLYRARERPQPIVLRVMTEIDLQRKARAESALLESGRSALMRQFERSNWRSGILFNQISSSTTHLQSQCHVGNYVWNVPSSIPVHSTVQTAAIASL